MRLFVHIHCHSNNFLYFFIEIEKNVELEEPELFMVLLTDVVILKVVFVSVLQDAVFADLINILVYNKTLACMILLFLDLF